jgi:hypothetical protein
MRSGCQKAMGLASVLTGKGLQRTCEVSGEGVTNRLICRPATSVLSLMSSDDPGSCMEGISSDSPRIGQTYVYFPCPASCRSKSSAVDRMRGFHERADHTAQGPLNTKFERPDRVVWILASFQSSAVAAVPASSSRSIVSPRRLRQRLELDCSRVSTWSVSRDDAQK